MNVLRLAALAASTALIVPASVHAAAAPPKPCASTMDRQFDFWAGNWRVTDNTTGKPAGTNTITHEYKRCVLQEHWTGTDGSHGSSFNHYDPARKVWHQTWVDDGGGLLLLDGGMRNGSMVLSGSRPGRQRKTVTDRITFTPRPDGSVRQWWQATRDGGATWKTVFDGIYRRSS